MRPPIVLLPLFAAIGYSQPVPPPGTNGTVQIVISRQPVSVYRAVLGPELKDQWGYAAWACSSADTPVSLSGGHVAAFAVGHGIPVVPIEAARLAAASARRHSSQYRIYQLGLEITYYVGVGSGFVNFGPGAANGILRRVLSSAPAALSREVSNSKERLDTQLPDPAQRLGGKVLRDEPITLAPGACVSLYFLGGEGPATSSGFIMGSPVK